MDTSKLNEQLNSANALPASEEGGIAGAKTLWLIVSSYLQVLINSAPPPMTLEELGAEIEGAHAQCQASPMAGLLYARNAGELLLEAQANLLPANWEIWLKANCNLSARTAETYMQMAKGWPGLPKEKRRDVAEESFVPSFMGYVENDSFAKTESIDDWEDDEELELDDIISEKQVINAELIEDIVSEGQVINPEVTEDILSKEQITTPELIENVEFVNLSPPQEVITVNVKKLPVLDDPQSSKVEKRDREVIIFFIPGNVVPKARPRVTTNGTYMPQRYRAWRNLAEVEIYSQLSGQDLTKLPIKKAEILMRFVGKHRTNSDLDNLAGACLDALTMNGAGVILDDRISCVSKLSVEYVPDANKTGVWIEITPVD